MNLRESKNEAYYLRKLLSHGKKSIFKELAVNTLRGYRPAYQRALDEFTGKPIRQIKPPDVKRFITEFSKGGRAEKTVSTQLLILSLIFGLSRRERIY